MSTTPKVNKPHHPKILPADREENGDFISKDEEDLIHRWLKNPIENWLEQNKTKWGGTTGISKEQWLKDNPLKKLNKKDNLVIVEYVDNPDSIKEKIRKVIPLPNKLKYSLIFPDDGRVYALYRGKEPKAAGKPYSAKKRQALGKGAYGVVKLGRVIERDEQVAAKNRAEGVVNLVAVKISEIGKDDKLGKKVFERETRATEKKEKKGKRSLLLKTKTGSFKGYGIMELGANSLQEYFPSIQSYEERLEIALACLKSLKEFQDSNLLHRDLKGPNILYNSETKEIRIVDIGLHVDMDRSKQFTEKRKKVGEKGNFTTAFGVDFYYSPKMNNNNYEYWGPESQSNKKHHKLNPPLNQFSKKTDIYSMGYMFSGPYDFRLLDYLKYDDAIIPSDRKILEKEIQLLINAMTNKNPFKRPSIDECIKEMQIIVNIYKTLKEFEPVDKLLKELNDIRKARKIQPYIYVDEMIEDFQDPIKKKACIDRIRMIDPQEINNNFDLTQRVLAWDGWQYTDPDVVTEVFQTLLNFGAPFVPTIQQMNLGDINLRVHRNPELAALLALKGVDINDDQFIRLFQTPGCRKTCLELLKINDISGKEPNSDSLLEKLITVLSSKMLNDPYNSNTILFKEIMSKKKISTEARSVSTNEPSTSTSTNTSRSTSPIEISKQVISPADVKSLAASDSDNDSSLETRSSPSSTVTPITFSPSSVLVPDASQTTPSSEDHDIPFAPGGPPTVKTKIPTTVVSKATETRKPLLFKKELEESQQKLQPQTVKIKQQKDDGGKQSPRTH